MGIICSHISYEILKFASDRNVSLSLNYTFYNFYRSSPKAYKFEQIDSYRWFGDGSFKNRVKK